MGLCAAKKLVVPVNSDDFSAGAIKMMLRKLYNRFPVGEDHPFHEEMLTDSFAAKSKKMRRSLAPFLSYASSCTTASRRSSEHAAQKP